MYRWLKKEGYVSNSSIILFNHYITAEMSAGKKIIQLLKGINERRNLAARKQLAVSHQGERQCAKPLTSEQKKEIGEFWESVSGTKKRYFDFFWYEVYNGVCQDPSQLKYYIPNDFYYCYVDYFFANDHFCRKFDDKTLYELYFPEKNKPLGLQHHTRR